ncbi:MAG: phospholipase D family protein [Hyphomicrobiales bacterium]
MAEFLTTLGTSNKIEGVIMESKKSLTLVSPYLKLTQIFLERLSDAARRGVNITIIYGKVDLKPKEEESLKALDNLKLYFSKNLHAKCYYNERSMVITSMNMYEFSEKNNREMGIFIDSIKNRMVYKNAVLETESILNAAKHIFSSQNLLEEENKKKAKETAQIREKKKNVNKGVCIRCKSSINMNPFYPLCDDCFKVWRVFENIDYEENYCHSCGKNISSSYSKPLCMDCFKDLPVDTKKELRNVFSRWVSGL